MAFQTDKFEHFPASRETFVPASLQTTLPVTREKQTSHRHNSARKGTGETSVHQDDTDVDSNHDNSECTSETSANKDNIDGISTNVIVQGEGSGETCGNSVLHNSTGRKAARETSANKDNTDDVSGCIIKLTKASQT